MINNIVFGELTFNIGWKTKTHITLFGTQYDVVVKVKAYFEKDGITPEQELAFADFKENKQMVSVREGELIVELGPVPRVCGNEACGQPIPMDNIAFCPYCGARVS